MTYDEGRYELGFPFRAWPWGAVREKLEEGKITQAQADELFNIIRDLEPEVNIRFANDDDTARVLASFNGKFPVYRSIYRFREVDEEGKPVRDSAIVDKLFFEFEHHACGDICQHTMGDVARFIHWLRRNHFEPWVLYSGGKSLHVYLMFDEVKVRRPHEVVKRALKLISQRARLIFVDHKAMLGTAQLARVMNAMNPKTGLYAIPIRADEVLQNGPVWVKRLATKPRLPSWKPIRNNRLHGLLQEIDAKIAEDELMAELFPPEPSQQLAEGEMCGNVKAVHGAPHDHPVRGHEGLRALLVHAYKQGMSMQEALEFVGEWNERSEAPMGRAYIRYQTEYAYKDRKTSEYNPCFVAAKFVGGCPVCMRPT